MLTLYKSVLGPTPYGLFSLRKCRSDYKAPQPLFREWLIDSSMTLEIYNIDNQNNEKHKQVNEEITTACVQSICVLINPNWQTKANCEVADFKKLQPTICSKRRPDTAVYYGNEVGFTSETCSSPMS